MTTYNSTVISQLKSSIQIRLQQNYSLFVLDQSRFRLEYQILCYFTVQVKYCNLIILIFTQTIFFPPFKTKEGLSRGQKKNLKKKEKRKKKCEKSECAFNIILYKFNIISLQHLVKRHLRIYVGMDI